MGYADEHRARRQRALESYKRTIEQITGDTNNIGSISLNWDGDKFVGDNEFTDYQENLPKEPTKADGNLVKEKLYLVVYNDGTDDGKWGVTKNLPAELTNPNGSINNSTNGIALEISGMRRGNIYQRENYNREWTRLAERYLMEEDDYDARYYYNSGWASKAYQGYTSRQGSRSYYGARELIKSGLATGFRDRHRLPQITNLDTGHNNHLWLKGRADPIDDLDRGWGVGDTHLGVLAKQHIEVDIDDEFNRYQNQEADRIGNLNRETNKKNAAKNVLYDKMKAVANRTQGGDYVNQRDKLTKEELLQAGISNSNANQILGQVKNVYKDFYRDEKLEKWDNSLGATPEFGSFDPNYYSSANAVARDRYQQAVAEDDIDFTERYGKNNYMWWHYTTVGKDAGARGNEAEVLNMARDYLEDAPDVQEGGWENQTDADLMIARDKQLGIVDEDIDMVNDVPEIKAAWEEAKNAKKEGEDSYWTKLAADNYLDINEANQFASLFRISASGNQARGVEPNEEHKKVLAQLVGSGSGITDVEDRITEAVGTQALLNVERFGALNQNVLKDAIAEMKQAKAKESELAMYRNFGQFNEVLNINETLSNSILGDSGIGGYLAITGDDEFSEEKLERSLSNITGVKNEVVHNWEKWFDEKISQKYQDDLDLGYTVDDAERNIQIQKEFAENYVNTYLKPRFDESRSMSEFIEYLDVRQEEQNPFQTQDILNAVQQVGQAHADSYLDALRQESDRGFNAEFYLDPTGTAGMNEVREANYEKQRDLVAADWETAKNNPNELVDELNPGLGTWTQQAYRFGSDVNDASQFARLHYQIKGQHENYKFDGAEDIMSPGKVKELIYTKIFPALKDEVARQPSVFGQFIRPEEFADDVLEGVDPNAPDTWTDALTGADGESLIEGFTGSFDELKQYIVDGMSGNSALDMRQSIKYLNEKKEKPTQELLGIDYIQREEDYKPIDQFKGDTQLFKIFQGAGYEGSEDDFYENVFPDLDPSSQKLLTEAGSKDGKIKIGGWDDSDPYAALTSVESFLGDDFGSTTKKSTDESKDKEEKKSSIFNFDPFGEDDEEDDDYKSKKGQEILGDFTSGFNFF